VTSPTRPEGWHGWDDYAAFYDWENARTLGRRDVPFWRGLAERLGGPVLELGCGTGRISISVARTGARYVGIDRSAHMLRRARTRLRRAKLTSSAHLVRGDIRCLPFAPRSFGLVLAPYGVVQSLIREADLADTLAAVARVTARDALFGIDLVPDVPRWAEYRRRVSLRGLRGPRRGGALTLVESVRQDRSRKLTTFDHEFIERRPGRPARTSRFSLTFRTLSVRQMAARLERAGFTVEALLGDYDGGPWDRRADVWVVLARRR
jgi:SAM-dependent methyltransferase